MPSHRSDRLNEDILRELCAIIRALKDPRLSPMLSVVKVEVARDLSCATCHVSSIEGHDATVQSVKVLRAAAGFIRRELGGALDLRRVPEIRFVADDSIAYSAHISKLLHDVLPDSGDEPSPEPEDGDEQQ